MPFPGLSLHQVLHSRNNLFGIQPRDTPDLPKPNVLQNTYHIVLISNTFQSTHCKYLILCRVCNTPLPYIHTSKFRFVAQFSYPNHIIKSMNNSTATLEYMRKARTVFCPDFLAQSYINSVFTTSSASDRTISSMRFRAASSISVQYCLTYTQLSLEGASLRFSCTPPHGLPASGRPAAPSTAPWRPPAPPPA